MKLLAVFDLDYTIWQPEMYQLWGPPKLIPVDQHKSKLSPEILRQARTRKDGHILVDRERSVMRVFDGANFALTEINRLRKEQGVQIQAAVASKTDEPNWAKICMDTLVVEDGTTLKECFGNRVEISYGSKVGHLKRLHKTTGVPYENMCFFDNEYGNIRSVSSGLPDVRCYYTPDGMTRGFWEQAMADMGVEG